jgi:hypothetical protein
VLGHAEARVREATSPRTRACFERHILAHEPAAAVAGGLGVTVNAVYVNPSNVLSRVRAKRHECLEDLSDDPQGLPGRP